jgi:predicted Zn finger-like uncharacterized protein
MKFLCDRCKTKYSIADEKVRRKILKIRCKNCANIITVRDPGAKTGEFTNVGTGAGGGEPLAGNLFPATQGGRVGKDLAALDASRDGEWFVAVAGTRQGPMPLARLGTIFERGDANGETFVWRDGFEDWVRADAVPEMKPFLRRPAEDRRASGARGLPKREVPRPSDGRLAGRSDGSSLPLGGASRNGSSSSKPAMAVASAMPRAKMEDLSDELEEDDDLPAAGSAGGHAGLFAAADAGALPDRKTPSGDGFDLAIADPSRIVKLDAIVAAGLASGAKAPATTGNAAGRVFTLQSESKSGGIVTAPLPKARSAPHEVYPAPPAPSQSEHRFYKLVALGAGLAVLGLVVVVVFLMQKPPTTKTIVVEREPSPEDVGAKIAEDLAREQARRHFPVPVAGADSIPDRKIKPRPIKPNPVVASTPGRHPDSVASPLDDVPRSGEKVEHGVNGQLEVSQEDTIGQFKRGAKICYERALKKNPSLTHVKIEVKISINGSGGATNVDIPSPYSSDFFGFCLSGLIRKLPWQPKGSSYEIYAPLVFTGS